MSTLDRLTSVLGDPKLARAIINRPLNTILRKEDKPPYSNLVKAVPIRKFDIPKEFDGREVWKGLLSPVINQGSCGSCWAFASTTVLADRFNIQSRGLMNIQLSPAKLILCDFQGSEFSIDPETQSDLLANLNTNSLRTTGCYGNSLFDAWRYLYLVGTNTEECVPYNQSIGLMSAKYEELGKFDNPGKLPLCNVLTGKIGDMCSNFAYNDFTGEETGDAAKFYRALHFYGIAGTKKDNGSEYNIRHNIFAWGPVSTGIEIYPDFYTFNPKTEIYEWNGKGPRVGGHAIVILGWGEDNGKPYWLIQNSWGKEWGLEGFLKMIRGKNNCKIEENVITGIPDYFYPIGYQISTINTFWLENPATILERNVIEKKLDITGGGIDTKTGYTRRAIITKPWLDLSRPVSMDDISDRDTFIAAIHAAKENRLKKIENTYTYKYSNTSIWVITGILILLCTLYFIHYLI